MSKESKSRTAPTPGNVGGPYAWYVLVVLVAVYVFNFIDRQILSILAEEIKADIGISDGEMGFLYGTAFAVFYAVFGLPLARLADLWTRRTLISLGLFFWSAMTALSGTARSFITLGAYRIGVGVGESSASPAAFSMLGDYFPPKFRASAMAIYSSGVYIGSGIGLFLGGWVVDGWASMYPDGSAPMNLKGWHVAFFVVGIPGLIMALWVRTLREPMRGQSEGMIAKEHPAPFREFGKELASVIPPFTFWSLIRLGAGARGVVTNLAMGAAIAGLAALLIALVGQPTQWISMAIGVFAVASWIQGLALRDRPAFTMIYRSPAMVFGMAGFAWIGFITYGLGFWFPPFIIRAHEVSAGEAGRFLGLAAAIGGWTGVTGGGLISDWLKMRTPLARIYMGFLTIGLTLPVALFVMTTGNVNLAYAGGFAYNLVSSMWIGSAVALSTELVLPRMRASATAFYILMVTFIGLALGPFTMGQISDAFVRGGADPADALRNGLMIGLLALVPAALCLLLSARSLQREENSRVERAREAGEPAL